MFAVLTAPQPPPPVVQPDGVTEASYSAGAYDWPSDSDGSDRLAWRRLTETSASTNQEGVAVLRSTPDAGEGKPPRGFKMWWRDPSGVVEDLDKFSSLYVRVHGCV